MEAPIEQTDDFAEFWQEASLNQRIELQNALFPEGLHYSEENYFFEPRNTRLFQAYTEMLGGRKLWRPQRGHFEPIALASVLRGQPPHPTPRVLYAAA